MQRMENGDQVKTIWQSKIWAKGKEKNRNKSVTKLSEKYWRSKGNHGPKKKD